MYIQDASNLASKTLAAGVFSNEDSIVGPLLSPPYAMHTPVVRPTNKPGTQGGWKAFEGCAVSGTDAPGATQYQGNGWVWFKHRLQDRDPFEQGMSCSLIRTHVDAFAGMPEHLLMVYDTIEVEVQNDVRAAWSGRGEIRGILVSGHNRMSGFCLVAICPAGMKAGPDRTQNLPTPCAHLRKRAVLGLQEQASQNLQATGLI